MVRLILMPLISDFGESFEFSSKLSFPLSPRTRLVFTRDHRIFEQFSNFPDKETKQAVVSPKELPAGVTIAAIEDDKEVASRMDGLGEPITFVKAKELKRLQLPDDSSQTDKAIKAYIDILPPDIYVVLMWD